jgi:hypothetical protein
MRPSFFATARCQDRIEEIHNEENIDRDSEGWTAICFTVDRGAQTARPSLVICRWYRLPRRPPPG